jgi:hypothetical protein
MVVTIHSVGSWVEPALAMNTLQVGACVISDWSHTMSEQVVFYIAVNISAIGFILALISMAKAMGELLYPILSPLCHIRQGSKPGCGSRLNKLICEEYCNM